MNTPKRDSFIHIELIERVESYFKHHFGLNELRDLNAVGIFIDLIIEDTI